MGYVTAFAGRRDNYEVAAALAEGGRLDAFVTDVFFGQAELAIAGMWSPAMRARLALRADPRIPIERVRQRRAVAALAAFRRQRGVPLDRVWKTVGDALGSAASREASRLGSDLLIYSSSGQEAFSPGLGQDGKRRVLFQLHPHWQMEREVMLRDREQALRDGYAYTQTLYDAVDVSEWHRHEDDAWRKADHILCASSCTKRSLVHAGANAQEITVIPYGIDLPGELPDQRDEHFHALFVGQGNFRKGLHHLLTAWRRADLPKSARLTVVARKVEPELRAMLRTVEGVDYLAGVSADRLNQLYSTASIFVMPSLMEGFGLVYLEALSYGLPVIGTANTGVPDLGDRTDGAITVPVGDSDSLAAELEMFARRNRDDPIHERARQLAMRYSWKKFRTGVLAALPS